MLIGDKVPFTPSGAGECGLANVLAATDKLAAHVGTITERVEHLRPLLSVAPEALTAPSITIATKAHKQIDVDLVCLDVNLKVVSRSISIPPGETCTLEDDLLAVLDGRSVGGAATAFTNGDKVLCIEGDEASLGRGHDPVARLLHQVLSALPVTGRLINLTSGAVADEDPMRDERGVGPAQAVGAVAGRLFPGAEPARRERPLTR